MREWREAFYLFDKNGDGSLFLIFKWEKKDNFWKSLRRRLMINAFFGLWPLTNFCRAFGSRGSWNSDEVCELSFFFICEDINFKEF
jgi:hypothetical protein